MKIFVPIKILGSFLDPFWSLGISRRTYGEFALVRACVRPFRSYSLDRSIFFWSLGFSRKAYGFTFVRSFVRHTPYLENRTSDFDDFLHKATS